MAFTAGYGLTLFFGLFVISFALPENITISGNASSYSTAINICKNQGQRLISVEGDKITNVTDFMKDNDINTVWINAEFETLKHWTFTDPEGTMLEDKYIDISHGGLCGAYVPGRRQFKSFICNTKLPALNRTHSEQAVVSFKSKDAMAWFSYEKRILATPPSNSSCYFEKFEEFVNTISNVNLDPKDSYWIGLHKFGFSLPDGTKVPLSELKWAEDLSSDHCLILRIHENDGSLKVVNCKGQKQHQVLCIPETDGQKGYPESLWLPFYIFLGMFLVLSVVVIAICVVEKKKKGSVYPAKNNQNLANGVIRENSLYAKAGSARTSVKRPLPERPVENHVIIQQIGEDKVNYEEVDLSP